jgi:hypothetical protein
MIVVLPFGSPGGTGLGSARKTTPAKVGSFGAVEAEGAVVSGAAGRSQPLRKKVPPNVRKSATAHKILAADGCFLSVSMIAIKNAHDRAQQVLKPRE